MITEKYKIFIEKASTNLIGSYEEVTNKKYNPNDLNSIIDVVNFLNGNVMYVNGLFSKYKTDEVLLSKEDGFTIIIDKKYRENQIEDTELSIKKIIFRMIWMYINEYLEKKGNIVSNEVLYPQNHYLNLQELLSFIEENNKEIKLNEDDRDKTIEKTLKKK